MSPEGSTATRTFPHWVVAHIITKLELGGAQRATLTELEHSQFGGRPRYLLAGAGGMLDAEAGSIAGVELETLTSLDRDVVPGRDARAFWDLVQALRRIRRRHRGQPLLVHTHSSKAGVLGRLAARLVGAQVIVHSIHGFGHGHFGATWASGLMYSGEWAASWATDAFTGDSAASLAQARAQGLLRSQAHAVVYCGIEPAAFETPVHTPAEVRAALGVATDAPLILTLACLKAQKDPRTYLHLARRVVDVLPTVRFVWAGDGEERATFLALRQRLGLVNEVQLLGWRTDVVDLLHAADLLLLTSRWEGLPQVLPQAMAAGRAVVATAVDGTPEAIDDGETGFVFPAGDAEAGAARVLELCAAPERRAAMGKAGRARVDHFSRAEMLRRLDDLYAGLASDSDRRRAG